MIFGCDHVALSCTRLEEGVDTLQGEGWSAKFSEPRLLNHELKRPFLARYAPAHGIAYCATSAGPALELTAHADTFASGRSSYQILFQCAPRSTQPLPDDILCASWSIQAQRPVKKWHWIPFNTPVYALEGAGPLSVQNVLCLTANYSRSVAFWKDCLGFTLGASGAQGEKHWSELRFKSPISALSLNMVLLEADIDIPAVLDCAGFPCVALLTSNLDAVLRRAESGALARSEPFTFPVNGKNLKIGLLRGPGGELVELIEIERKPLGAPA